MSDTSIPCFVASGNMGKAREILEMIAEYFPALSKPTVRAPKQAVEDGDSFRENAFIKARALEKELLSEGLTSYCVFADDSGLCVDALNGNPGVYSARYAGENVSANEHIKKLLRELHTSGSHTLEQRAAHYHCALVRILSFNNDRSEDLGEGRCEGFILSKAQGESGFGYDPVFYSPQYQKSFADLLYSEKNSISHRRGAFEALKAKLKDGTS